MMREALAWLCALTALLSLSPILLVVGLSCVFNDASALLVIPWWGWGVWALSVVGWAILRRQYDLSIQKEL